MTSLIQFGYGIVIIIAVCLFSPRAEPAEDKANSIITDDSASAQLAEEIQNRFHTSDISKDRSYSEKGMRYSYDSFSNMEISKTKRFPFVNVKHPVKRESKTFKPMSGEDGDPKVSTVSTEPVMVVESSNDAPEMKAEEATLTISSPSAESPYRTQTQVPLESHAANSTKASADVNIRDENDSVVPVEMAKKEQKTDDGMTTARVKQEVEVVLKAQMEPDGGTYLKPGIEVPTPETSSSPPDTKQSVSVDDEAEAVKKDTLNDRQAGHTPEQTEDNENAPATETATEKTPEKIEGTGKDVVMNLPVTVEKQEENVKLEVDSIKSFEEWKKQHIQNQEDAAAADVKASAPRTTIRTKKTQVNYASQDCGAKILGHNPEAKHMSAILDENKDMYMLNPCSANIWFVVELCEPIQIRQLQLANLELFSSAPKLFVVSISERYPSREWRPVGAFEARNERTLQTFGSPREELMFAKYVKFEMKSHFGSEHFCPLTMLRVLGVSMVEEYEETEDKDQKSEETLDSSESAEAISAEEAAVGDVTEDSGSIGKMLNMMKSAVGSLLGNGAEPSKVNATSSTNSSSNDQNKTSEEETIDTDWESPITLVTNRSEVESTKRPADGPIVTLVETGDGQEIVYVQPVPPFYDLTFLSKLTSRRLGTRLCWFLEFIYRVSVLSCIIHPAGNQTSVSGAFPHVDSSHLSPAPPSAGEHKSNPASLPKEGDETFDFVLVGDPQADAATQATTPTKTEGRPDEVTSSGSNLEPELGAHVAGKAANSAENAAETSLKENGIDAKPNEAGETVQEKVDDLPERKEENRPSDDEPEPWSQQGKGQDPASPLLSQTAQCQVAKTVSSKDSVALDSSDSAAAADEAQKNLHIDTDKKALVVASANTNPSENTPAESEVDQTAANEILQRKPAVESVDNVSVTQSGDVTSPAKEEITGEDVAQPATDNSEAAPPESATTAIPPLLEKNGRDAKEFQVIGENQVVINPGTNQKESILMRLSNRIRALEQNMSLSSAYLEDLSQRYKRQMDELQKAFNRTKTRMAEVSRKTEEKEQKQDDAIASAHNESATLRLKLNDMEASHDYLNREMVARHICLMAVECVVLIIVLVTCFGSRQYRLLQRIEKSEREVTELRKLATFKIPNSHVTADKRAGDDKNNNLMKKEGTAIKAETLHHRNSCSESLIPAVPSRSSPALLRSRSWKSSRNVRKKRNGAVGIVGRGRKSVSQPLENGACPGLPWSHDRPSLHGTLISDFTAACGGNKSVKSGRRGASAKNEKKLGLLSNTDAGNAKLFSAGNGIHGAGKFSSKLTMGPACKNDLITWQNPSALPRSTFSGKAR